MKTIFINIDHKSKTVAKHNWHCYKLRINEIKNPIHLSKSKVFKFKNAFEDYTWIWCNRCC
jgi:hypothetical protein